MRPTWILLLALVLSACTGPSGQVEVRWRVTRDRAQTFDGMSCYFLSVAASDIEPSDTLPAYADAACLDLGTTSALVDAATLTSSGVSLEVPAGTGRTIRAMGLRYPGGQCPSTVSEAFTTTVPKIYVLGSVSQDLLVSDTVAIPNQIPSATNIVRPPCADVREYLYIYTDMTSKVQKVEVDMETGLPGTGGDALATPFNQMCVDPLGRYVVGVGTGSSVSLRPLNGDGTLGTDTSVATAGPPAACQFSPDGRFLYVAQSVSSDHSFRVFQVLRGADSLIYVNDSALVGGGGAAITGFLVTQGSLFVESTVGEIFARDETTGELSNQTTDAIARARYFSHPYLDLVYWINSSASPQAVGVGAPNGANIVSQEAQNDLGSASSNSYRPGCVSPDGEVLYMPNDVSGSPELRYISLLANGLFDGVAAVDSLTAKLLSECVIHSSGNTLFLGDTDASNETFYYPISADGTPGVHVTVSGLGRPKKFGFATVPQ